VSSYAGVIYSSKVSAVFGGDVGVSYVTHQPINLLLARAQAQVAQTPPQLATTQERLPKLAAVIVNRNGRDDWIRTSDLTHPKRARYQAAPRPVSLT
jgi:hypothetical protein